MQQEKESDFLHEFHVRNWTYSDKNRRKPLPNDVAQKTQKKNVTQKPL
jgi:hypothetical protein